MKKLWLGIGVDIGGGGGGSDDGGGGGDDGCSKGGGSGGSDDGCGGGGGGGDDGSGGCIGIDSIWETSWGIKIWFTDGKDWLNSGNGGLIVGKESRCGGGCWSRVFSDSGDKSVIDFGIYGWDVVVDLDG